ncbi:keto reductase [Rhexocercosporidium sp. MPI-PUGE-AT-0058]|nr:keto reductase [Rhexocercosporidium sp. MPI-PUGE-AT-0058]
MNRTTNDLNGASAKTALKIVLGTSNLGKEGKVQVRVHDSEEIASILNTFQKYGHKEIDTARIYGGGSTEECLSDLNWRERGLIIGTKLVPLKKGPFSYSHTKEGVNSGLTESLKALQTEEVDLWSLHLPDHNTPYEETLKAVNELYNAGRFKRFGISCYTAAEVAQICGLCERNGWKKPDVYSGLYNGVQRNVEPELFPCLRHYKIAFYMFRPLQKGLLTDKAQRGITSHGLVDAKVKADPNSKPDTRRQDSNEAEFDALDVIRPVTQKLGITTAEAALRWASHHSLLRSECGDAIMIGASSAVQLEQSLESLEKGPLPDEMVKAFDDGWALVKPSATPYFL